MSVTFTVRSATGEAVHRIEVEPRQMILGGFSARSEEERERHIAELREIGIEPVPRTPAFWHMSTNLLTTGSRIEVQGDATSGEVEYALFAHAGRTYVTVASDQTDREFERTSIPRSKSCGLWSVGRIAIRSGGRALSRCAASASKRVTSGCR